MAKEVAYGKAPKGKLLYDLVFTGIKPSYLKVKHRLSCMTIEQIADLRMTCKAEIWPKRYKKKRTKAKAKDA